MSVPKKPGVISQEAAMFASTSDDTWPLLKDSAQSYLASRHDRKRLRGRVSTGGGAQASIWRDMAELGWLTLTLPEVLGGSGLSLGSAASLCELLGAELVPEPIIACGIMPAALLAACQASETRQRLAQQLSAGAPSMTIAWQETVGQLHPDMLRTRLDSNGRLTGTKVFVPMPFDDATFIVHASSDQGPVLVAVGSDAPGISVYRRPTGDGTFTATLTFNGSPIDDEPLVEGESAGLALRQALDSGTIGLAAALAGLASGALDLTLQHMRTRVQFGRPIGEFQALQHRAVDLYIAVQLAKASWRAAAEGPSRRSSYRDDLMAISAAKARCSAAALSVSKASVQVHGALGFTEEADIGLYLRAAMYWASWLGTESLHRRRYWQLSQELRA
jgi:alkylation response protein AidB-like acyl-CoA dehydrogenase